MNVAHAAAAAGRFRIVVRMLVWFCCCSLVDDHHGIWLME